jgi:hypothetical protein
MQSLQANPQHTTLLSYFNSSSGVTPIVNKLPYGIQKKWAGRATKYKRDNGVPYPPFAFFVSFIRETSEAKNYPVFKFDITQNRRPEVFSRKQEILSSDKVKGNRCPFHRADHQLNSCRGFLTKPFEERKKILRESGVCFKCCDSTNHTARNCSTVPRCGHCGKGHASAMHLDKDEKVCGK